MKWTCRLAVILCSCAIASAHAAYDVVIQAPAPLDKLLRTHLDLSRYRNRDDLGDEHLQFMLDTLDEQVQQLTSTEGYFSPLISVKVEPELGSLLSPPQASGSHTGVIRHIQVRVEAGPHTSINSLDINADGGSIEPDAGRIADIRAHWSLPLGARFRQQDWDNAKNQGLEKLQRHDYAAARIAHSQATIHPEDQAADLSVRYDSGPRFTLGPLQITGTRRYPDSIIEHVNPLNIGEEYDVNRLLSLQRQIQNTPYFSNAIVGIDNDPEHAERAPVKVQVSEYPIQRIRTGLGYATDTGAQVEGRYTHLNVFDRAWMFDSQLRIEQKRQFGLLNLAMPPDTKNFVNSINTSWERTKLEGVDLRSFRSGLRRSRNGELYDTAYTLTYYRDELQLENAATLPSNTIITPGQHQALVPGFSWARRNVDDPIFPRQGNLLTLETGFAVKGIVTDQTFARLYGRFKQYFPIAKRDMIILRTELGGVLTQGSAAQVPASLLFRAGGNESVRGYSFQSIGNEQKGIIYPTKYLLTGSVEYQHWFTETWGSALFYDAGSAADSWIQRQFYNGVGGGARWRSPVGSLNLDLAYGVQKQQFRPHISLGIAF